MNAAPPLKEGGVRFVAPGLLNFAFIRYPATTIPDDNTMAFAEGPGWRRVGIYRNGAWKDDKGRPLKDDFTYWTVIAPDQPKP